MGNCDLKTSLRARSGTERLRLHLLLGIGAVQQNTITRTIESFSRYDKGLPFPNRAHVCVRSGSGKEPESGDMMSPERGLTDAHP